MSLVRTLDRPFIIFLITEIVNHSISQSATSELSRQSSFGGSHGEELIDLVDDKKCSEGWMHIKLRPGIFNVFLISRTEGVTLYADVKKFNLLKDLRLDYYGDLSCGGFLFSTRKNAKCCSCCSGFKLL